MQLTSEAKTANGVHKFDPGTLRRDFPILDRKINGKRTLVEVTKLPNGKEKVEIAKRYIVTNIDSTDISFHDTIEKAKMVAREKTSSTRGVDYGESIHYKTPVSKLDYTSMREYSVVLPGGKWYEDIMEQRKGKK